jgi:hypothetical protein
VLLVTYEDPEGHGDPRPVVEALAATHATGREERFPGREALVLRVFEAGSGDRSGEREER